MKFSILSWNIERNKEALEVLLEEAKYDVLAIQEPWKNKQTGSTYCPRSSKYHLVHSPEGRAAIFVSRRHEVGLWDYEAAHNWCRVQFPTLGTNGLEVWSVYNPRQPLANTNDTPPLPNLLQRPAPTTPVVVAGDFNLHHPL